MKKWMVALMLVVGFLGWHFTGGEALAQLVGVQRSLDHLWMPASKQVRLGDKPESYLTYESNKLKLDVDTGKTIELLVNGAAEYDFTSTAADFKANNFVTTGTVGGGAATFTSGSFTDGNVTNVGDIDVDSVSADGTTVDYMDVNALELTQEDVGATCALGAIRLDTGGATKELCYCQATNTWLCAALAAGPTD